MNPKENIFYINYIWFSAQFNESIIYCPLNKALFKDMLALSMFWG